MGRITNSGFYSVNIRISSEANELAVISIVSGLVGKTTKRTMRGTGVVDGLSRGTNLKFMPLCPWKKGVGTVDVSG